MSSPFYIDTNKMFCSTIPEKDEDPFNNCNCIDMIFKATKDTTFDDLITEIKGKIPCDGNSNIYTEILFDELKAKAKNNTEELVDVLARKTAYFKAKYEDSLQLLKQSGGEISTKNGMIKTLEQDLEATRQWAIASDKINMENSRRVPASSEDHWADSEKALKKLDYMLTKGFGDDLYIYMTGITSPEMIPSDTRPSLEHFAKKIGRIPQLNEYNESISKIYNASAQKLRDYLHIPDDENVSFKFLVAESLKQFHQDYCLSNTF